MTNKLVSFLQLQQEKSKEKKQIWHKKVFLEHEGKKCCMNEVVIKLKKKF